jgi:hypothetical protein
VHLVGFYYKNFCYLSFTCFVLVVRSYLLHDRHSDTLYMVVCSGLSLYLSLTHTHTHTHYKLNHHQFQLACIAVLLIYLFMRTSQIDSDGLPYAVVLARQTSGVDLTYGFPQTPMFAECRTTRVYKVWLWS